MKAEYIDKIIPVSKILLDLNNPRFGHLELDNRKPTDSQMQAEIEADKDTFKLIKDIMRVGVTDPILVKDLGDGTYLVGEGNRRTTCLRKLIREGAVPKNPNVSYHEVKAHVYPKDYSDQKWELLKGRVQTGKKSWKTSDMAKYVWGLRYDMLIEIEDIAVAMQLSMKKVNEHINNWNLFKEYASHQKDTNPSQFSYFQEAPAKVKKFYNENDTNKHKYFEMISPTSGNQKIRGAAFGLRDFAKVLDDVEALDAVMHNPKVSMEQAVEIMKQNSAVKAMPFLARIDPLARSILNLSDEEIEQIKNEREIKVNTKKLVRACEQLLKKLD